MVNTARQLKDLIRNLSKKNAADAQILMRNYMMERFLERVSLSAYRDKFILKGGMLVAAWWVSMLAQRWIWMQRFYGSTLDSKTLHAAILATASKRGTERHLAEAAEVFDEVENSMVMQNLWEAYQKKFSYALDFEWHEVLFVIRKLYAFIFKCNC